MEGGAKMPGGSFRQNGVRLVLCLDLFDLLDWTLEDSRPRAQKGRGPVRRFQAKVRRPKSHLLSLTVADNPTWRDLCK